MPTELNDLIVYIAAFIFVIALIAFLAWLLKSLFQGGASAGGLLRRSERRLAVVDSASVDGRRRLILIRRDGTEHLIMTGGPVDLVIETGIRTPVPADRRAESLTEDRDVVIERDHPKRSADIIERE